MYSISIYQGKGIITVKKAGDSMQYRFDSSIYLKAFNKMLITGIIFQVLNAYSLQSKIFFSIVCGVILLGIIAYGYLFADSRKIAVTINDTDIAFGVGKEEWVILWNEISMVTMDRDKNIYVHPKEDENNPFPIPGNMENIDNLIAEFTKQCRARDILIRFALF